MEISLHMASCQLPDKRFNGIRKMAVSKPAVIPEAKLQKAGPELSDPKKIGTHQQRGGLSSGPSDGSQGPLELVTMSGDESANKLPRDGFLTVWAEVLGPLSDHPGGQGAEWGGPGKDDLDRRSAHSHRRIQIIVNNI